MEVWISLGCGVQFVTASHTQYLYWYSYPYPRGFHKKKNTHTKKKGCRQRYSKEAVGVWGEAGIFCLGVWGVPWGPHEFFFFSFRVVVSLLLQRRFTTTYTESHSFKRDVTLSLVVVFTSVNGQRRGRARGIDTRSNLHTSKVAEASTFFVEVFSFRGAKRKKNGNRILKDNDYCALHLQAAAER